MHYWKTDGASTAFILSLLSSVLKPLARLSKSLQSGTGDIVNAMQHAIAVKDSLSQMIESNFAVVESTSNDMIRSAKTAGVFIEPDTSSMATVKTMAKKYVQLIIGNMNERFNDSVGQIGLADLHVVLKEKPQIADFSKLCALFKVSDIDLQSEWAILRRLPCDLSSVDSLMMLCTSTDKRILFPNFSYIAHKILLMPIGTAGVERSFSTMNRVLRSERCRLLPTHVNALMQLSIEGPCMPDVRDGTPEQEAKLNVLIEGAVNEWNKAPRRRVV